MTGRQICILLFLLQQCQDFGMISIPSETKLHSGDPHIKDCGTSTLSIPVAAPITSEGCPSYCMYYWCCCWIFCCCCYSDCVWVWGGGLHYHLLLLLLLSRGGRHLDIWGSCSILPKESAHLHKWQHLLTTSSCRICMIPPFLYDWTCLTIILSPQPSQWYGIYTGQILYLRQRLLLEWSVERLFLFKRDGTRESQSQPPCSLWFVTSEWACHSPCLLENHVPTPAYGSLLLDTLTLLQWSLI